TNEVFTLLSCVARHTGRLECQWFCRSERNPLFRDADVLRCSREAGRFVGAFSQSHDEVVRKARHGEHWLLGALDQFGKQAPLYSRLSKPRSSREIVERVLV